MTDDDDRNGPATICIEPDFHEDREGDAEPSRLHFLRLRMVPPGRTEPDLDEDPACWIRREEAIALRNRLTAWLDQLDAEQMPRKFYKIEDGAYHSIVAPSMRVAMLTMAELVDEEAEAVTLTEISESMAKNTRVRADEVGDPTNLGDAPMGSFYSSEF